MTLLETPGITALLGSTVTTDDGAVLATDVVLPGAAGPHPTLLIRTPYGTRSFLAEARGWARRGWAVVLQDVRGRFESSGSWQPWTHEGLDGQVAVRWIRAQSWSDQRVVAYGTSYAAHCALEVAAAVDGVIAGVPALSLGHTVREPSGVPRLLAHATWWPAHGHRRTPHGPLLDLFGTAAADPLTVIPVSAFPERLGVVAPGWLSAWRSARTPVPAGPPDGPPLLVIAGRHDVYSEAALHLWRGWSGRSAHLVLGPWFHDLGLARRTDHPRRAQVHLPVRAFLTGWLDSLRVGNLPARRRRVNATEGATGWSVAGSLPGVGEPRELRPLTRPGFRADPDDPHPALLGPVDAGEVLLRADATVWTTGPTDHDLTLVGEPVVRLAGLRVDGRSGRVPVDWCVRWVVRDRNGRTTQLGHGAVRTADDTVDLVLPPVADRIPVGSELLVQVSGHQFPVHPRDPQDGSDPLTCTVLRAVDRQVGGVTLQLPVEDQHPTIHDDDQVNSTWL